MIHTLGFLKTTVSTNGQDFVSWVGMLGVCQVSPETSCTSPKIGFAISAMINRLASGTNVTDKYDALTKAMIIHPLAALLSFIAFLISLFSNRFGFVFVNIASGIAGLFTFLVFLVDVLIFSFIRLEVNKVSGVSASYGPAFAFVVVAFFCLVVAQFFSFWQCCCGRSRRERRMDEAEKMGFLDHHHKKTSKNDYHNPYTQISIHTH